MVGERGECGEREGAGEDASETAVGQQPEGGRVVVLVSSRVACLERRAAQSAKQIAVVLAGGRDVYGNRIQDGEGYAEEYRDSTAWLDQRVVCEARGSVSMTTTATTATTVATAAEADSTLFY